MSKFIDKLPKISLLALLFVSVVIAVLFWVGGSEQVEIAGNPWDQPNFTDSLLNWSYLLLGLTIAITLVISLVGFVKNFIANPRKGIVSLCVIIVFVAIFVTSWFFASPEKIEIIGYEGTDNSGFWMQYTEMCMYVVYTLGVATISALFGSILYSKIK